MAPAVHPERKEPSVMRHRPVPRAAASGRGGWLRSRPSHGVAPPAGGAPTTRSLGVTAASSDKENDMLSTPLAPVLLDLLTRGTRTRTRRPVKGGRGLITILAMVGALAVALGLGMAGPATAG